MGFELPPIVKLAESVLAEIESSVSRFPRYHKYAHGTTLRQQAMHVAVLAHRAWRDRRRQALWLKKLIWAVDDLKLKLQLAKQINAIGFSQFEHLARQVASLGRQCGGWFKQQHLKEQSPAAGSVPERLQILSAPTASAEATG